MQNTSLDGNRGNPISIFQYCNLPNCICQVQQQPPHHKQTPPANPLQTQYLPHMGMGGQTQNKGGAQGGDRGQTQNKGGAQGGDGVKPQISDVPKVGMGDKPKTKEVPKVGMGEKPQISDVPKVGMGDKPKTKEVPKVGMGDKPKTKEVPKVGMGDKPQISDVPKEEAGELPMVPVKQPPQRNIKFEQDRKRCSTDTDGKNLHENKRVHRDACVSDLVWPICKIDNTEYSK